jgi:glycosyltransferase involved in cell wall biosynthesis
MRILFVTSVYPTPYAATKGTFNAALVTGLHLAGDDVRVIAPVPWTERVRRRPTGVAADGVNHPIWFYPPKFGHAKHHRWMRRSVLPAAAAVTEEWTPDVVLGYWTHPDGTVALEVAERLGVPGVLIVGGSDIQILTRDPARRAIILETLQRAARVLTIGEALRERVVALGVPSDQVIAFSRGVDRERFSPGDRGAARQRLGLPMERPIALWVGRMVPVKGLDVLLAAWPQVPQTAVRPLLLLAGEGEERPMLELASAASGDSVRFVGSIAHAALPEWYRAADLVVLPSRSEGIPNVLLEGLACGTPFVASAVGGVPSLLEPESRVVPAEDIGALAVALTERLTGPLAGRVANADHVPDRQDGISVLRATLHAMIAAPAPAVPA